MEFDRGMMVYYENYPIRILILAWAWKVTSVMQKLKLILKPIFLPIIEKIEKMSE